MPRALLSVSDKTGIADLGRGLVARGFELVSTGGTAARAGRCRPRRDRRLRADRFSRDDGRPRQDAAPGAARRHPGAARSARRSGGPRGTRPRAGRCRRRQPVPVRRRPPRIRPPASTRWSRRSTSAARRWCGPPPRTSAACWWSSIRQTTRGCWRRSIAGPSLGFRFDLMRKAIAHTAAYDTAICRDADDHHARRRSLRATGASGGAASRLSLPLAKLRDLRYGENPHQPAAWYAGGAGAR